MAINHTTDKQLGELNNMGRTNIPHEDKGKGCLTCKHLATAETCLGCMFDPESIYNPYSNWEPKDDLAKAADELKEAVGTTDPNGLKSSDPGAKLDFGKDKWYLLPWRVIQGVVQVMTFGAKKYSENGWKEVEEAKKRYFAAMMRHWMLMQEGEYHDPDSGLAHWKHFVCNAVFLGYFYLKSAPSKDPK